MSLDIATLQPGCYRLTRPIANPKPDRRSKDWHNLPEIQTGLYFVTLHDERREINEPEIDVHSVIVTRRVVIERSGEHRYLRSVETFYRSTDEGLSWARGRSDGDDLAHAMLMSGELAHDDSLAAFLRFSERVNYLRSRDVLLRLVASGVVSEDAVRVAVAAQAEADAREEV